MKLNLLGNDLCDGPLWPDDVDTVGENKSNKQHIHLCAHC